eukprot:361082-Chlamydomonas_euryale.AAC.17
MHLLLSEARIIPQGVPPAAQPAAALRTAPASAASSQSSRTWRCQRGGAATEAQSTLRYICERRAPACKNLPRSVHACTHACMAHALTEACQMRNRHAQTAMRKLISSICEGGQAKKDQSNQFFERSAVLRSRCLV